MLFPCINIEWTPKNRPPKNQQKLLYKRFVKRKPNADITMYYIC